MLSASAAVAGLILAAVNPQIETPAVEQREIASPPAAPGLIQSLPIDPTQRAALQSAVDSRDYNRAEAVLAEALDLHPKSPQLLALAGAISFLNGNYLNAAIAMKKSDALSPLSNRDRFTLAMAYVALERPDWARPELEKLAQSGEKDPLYPYWLSRLDYRDMNFESALANGRRAVEWDPGFVKGYDNLGLTYEAMGNTEEALKAYGEAVKVNRGKNPPSPWPAMNLGALLVKLGRCEEAEPSLRESLSYDPRFPQAHFHIGLTYEKESKLSDAIRELELAASFDPTYAEPHFALGRIYKRLGESEKSAREYETFRKMKEQQSRASKLRKQSR
jgi:tetratricopeptide (TPR) repeat protein